jgi:hypothetical protein
MPDWGCSAHAEPARDAKYGTSSSYRPPARTISASHSLPALTRHDRQAFWIATPARSAIIRATFLGRKNVKDENLASLPSVPSTQYC